MIIIELDCDRDGSTMATITITATITTAASATTKHFASSSNNKKLKPARAADVASDIAVPKAAGFTSKAQTQLGSVRYWSSARLVVIAQHQNKAKFVTPRGVSERRVSECECECLH